MRKSILFRRRIPHAERGFTLLLAALVASVVLALGAAIFSIAQKQVTLSSIGRDSQFAFYAADTAAECALYWDFRCNYFASSTTAIDPTCTIPDPPGPLCDGQALKPFAPDRPSPPAYPYTMASQRMDFFPDPAHVPPILGYCAEVYVTKSLDSVTGAVKTLIHADGYSVSCASILVSPRALQRSVELHY